MEEAKKPFRDLANLSVEDMDTEKLEKAWKGLEGAYLNQELTSSMGYLSALWSTTEMILMMLILKMHQFSESAIVLVIEMTFLQRIDAITSSASLSGDRNLFDEWCSIEKDFNKLRTERNNIIHGAWLTEEESHFLLRASSRGILKYGRTAYEARDIKKVVARLLNVMGRLKAFYEKVEKLDIPTMMKTNSIPLDRTQSQAALAQIHARDQKRQRRTPPQKTKMGDAKLSSAQKRALRDAENQNKDEKS